jgi:hypothetical protein
MVRSMEGGGEGMCLCGRGRECRVQMYPVRGEGGLSREGQGNGYQGHIGICMVREGM